MPQVWGGIHLLSELQRDPYEIYLITEAVIRNIYTVYDQDNEGVKVDFGKITGRLGEINGILIRETAVDIGIQYYQP